MEPYTHAGDALTPGNSTRTAGVWPDRRFLLSATSMPILSSKPALSLVGPGLRIRRRWTTTYANWWTTPNYPSTVCGGYIIALRVTKFGPSECNGEWKECGNATFDVYVQSRNLAIVLFILALVFVAIKDNIGYQLQRIIQDHECLKWRTESK